jgi:hypothetical protein
MIHRIRFTILAVIALLFATVPAFAADTATSPQAQAALVKSVLKSLDSATVKRADSLAHDSAAIAAKDSAKTTLQAAATRKATAQGAAAGGLFSGLLVALGGLWTKVKWLPGQLAKLVKNALNDPDVQTVGIDAAKDIAKAVVTSAVSRAVATTPAPAFSPTSATPAPVTIAPADPSSICA